jgi:hypothetical protein
LAGAGELGITSLKREESTLALCFEARALGATGGVDGIRCGGGRAELLSFTLGDSTALLKLGSAS